MTQRLALWLLRLLGWHLVPRTAPEKCLIIAYPHTSNWDFLHFVLARIAYGMHFSFLGKAEIFRFGAGPFMRAIGGMAVDRAAPNGVVHQVTAMFASLPELRLAIAPEGTRRRTDAFKSGFYRIALEANVPLMLAKLDYSDRSIDLGPVLDLTGDPRVDMAAIRARYVGVTGRYPEQMGAIRLKDEESPST